MSRLHIYSRLYAISHVLRTCAHVCAARGKLDLEDGWEERPSSSSGREVFFFIEVNERLEGENTQRLRNQSFEKSFEVDDGKVKFYSGLPSFAVLMAVFKFASADISSRHRAGPTSFVQFLIVLMKLRLNLTDRDLAYRFRVSQSSISKYFGKWIHILYIRMKHLIVWPVSRNRMTPEQIDPPVKIHQVILNPQSL